MTENKKPNIVKELTYIEKVWQTVAIVALLVVGILVLRVAFNVLLMVLAGSLIAVYFHGLGDLIQNAVRDLTLWRLQNLFHLARPRD